MENIENMKNKNNNVNNNNNNDIVVYLFLIFTVVISVVVYTTEEGLSYILGELFVFCIFLPLAFGLLRLVVGLFIWFGKGLLDGLIHGFHFDQNKKWRP